MIKTDKKSIISYENKSNKNRKKSGNFATALTEEKYGIVALPSVPLPDESQK